MRTTTESLKRAFASFQVRCYLLDDLHSLPLLTSSLCPPWQNAAGVFKFLLDLLPSLPSLSNLGNTVYDFREGYLETMKVLMSAMAQECFWQQAVLGTSNHSPWYTDWGFG